MIVPLHLSHVRKRLVEVTSEPQPLLTPFAQELFASPYEELCRLDDGITDMEKRMEEAFHREQVCQNTAEVEGVGRPVIATAIVAAIADGKAFRNRRQLAAWLGLVPRQHSSGDK